MQMFKVKWENIMTIVLLVETVYTWIAYFKYSTEVRMLAIATLTTFALVIMLISYKEIKAFREDVIRQWK